MKLGEVLYSLRSCILLAWAAQHAPDGVVRCTLLAASGALLLRALSTFGFDYWRERGVPHPPPLALLGNIKDIALFKVDIGTGFKIFYDRYANEKYFGMYQLYCRTLVVRSPVIFRAMCGRDFAHFTDRGFFFNETRDPLADSILFATGDRWRRLRAKLSPIFSPNKLKGMVQLVEEAAQDLVDVLQEGCNESGEVTKETLSILGHYTTDATVPCALGVRSRCLRDPQDAFTRILHIFYEMTPWNVFEKVMRQFWPAFVLFFRMRMIDARVDAFFRRAVRQVVSARATQTARRRGDMIDILMQMRTEHETDKHDDVIITDNLIAGNAFIVLLGGHETSATTLTFCLAELASHPHLQDKLRREIQEAELHNAGRLTYDSLKELTYMDMIIQETLRLYPPFQNIQRLCTQDYRIPDCELVVEKDIIVVYPLFAVQRDPQYFPDPLKFDPERFSEEGKKSIIPGTYLPFGDGPRYCIGQRFASVQSKMCLARVLSAFSVRHPDPRPLRPFALENKSVNIRPKQSTLIFTRLP